MRIAVIANIQGNLTALQAVLDDLDHLVKPVGGIISAGDMVGLGPHPNEVLDLLLAREVESLRGNYDDAVAFPRLGSGVDFATPEEEAEDQKALTWTQETLRPEHLAYLRKLPRDVRLLPGGVRLKVKRDAEDERTAEYRRNFLGRMLLGGMANRTPREPFVRVRVTHGSPRSLNEFLRADTANSILATVARDAEADVLVSAHAQVAFQREAHNMTFVGAGSISSSFRPGVAEYIILETGRRCDVEFRQVGYDPAEHRRSILESGLPSALAAW